MNILILSVGTRNKIVQYFKKELQDKGIVIATDASDLAPGLYEADKYYVVPRINDPNYIATILKICEENNVDGVLSLIDPELSLLSKNKKKFLDIGVTPIVSDFNITENSFNKFEFSKYVESLGFNTVKTYKDIKYFEEDLKKRKISFPVFVKPINGSASININKVNDMDQLNELFTRFCDLVIQEYMDEKEYGVDVYIDMLTNEVVSIFIKEKILMRAGETDKSVSIQDQNLRNLILHFVEASNYSGVIDIDVFKKNGEYYISEVNPRFGGGYPHAYESGINIPRNIVQNLEGNKNSSNFEYDEDIYMMKYNDIRIIRKGLNK